MSAKDRYDALTALRQPYIDRAREVSALTIPTLYPPDGTPGGGKLYQPYQSVGAFGVSNLAAKLLTATVPPNTPFFRLSVNEFSKSLEGAPPEFFNEVNKAFRAVERSVQAEIEASGDRVAIEEAYRHMIVSGNALLYRGDSASARVWPLTRYVIQRDPFDRIYDLVVEDIYVFRTLPESAKAALLTVRTNTDADSDVDQYSVYTRIKLEETGRYTVYQEIEGVTIEGSFATFSPETLPWFPMRMTKVSGEDYGRSYLDSYMGDLHTLEALTKAVVEGTAAGTKIVVMVNPHGMTSKKDVATARNGAVISGQLEDVNILQVARQLDFTQAVGVIARIEQRLQQAFLMYASIQRDGERVTAEEIRTLARDLEASLGGVYSLLTVEFQLPYVRRLLAVVERKTAMPKLSKEVKPSIVTGLEALGRGQDTTLLTTFIQTLTGTLGPEATASLIDAQAYTRRLANSLGIDPDGLVKTPEAIAAEQQNAVAGNIIEEAAPDMLASAVQ